MLTQIAGPNQSPEEFCKKKFSLQFYFIISNEGESCSTCRLLVVVAWGGWVKNDIWKFETKKSWHQVNFVYTFLRTQVQRHPTPPALLIANWLYLFLSPHTTFSSCVPSLLMCFPVAFCFHTGTVSYLTQACFPSCWSNCHVVCQVLEYTVFSSCCSVLSACVLHCAFSPRVSCSKSLAPDLLHISPKPSAPPDFASSSSPVLSLDLAVFCCFGSP